MRVTGNREYQGCKKGEESGLGTGTRGARVRQQGTGYMLEPEYLESGSKKGNQNTDARCVSRDKLKYPPSSWGQVEMIAGTCWLLGDTCWWTPELKLSTQGSTVPPAGEPGPDCSPHLNEWPLDAPLCPIACVWRLTENLAARVWRLTEYLAVRVQKLVGFPAGQIPEEVQHQKLTIP